MQFCSSLVLVALRSKHEEICEGLASVFCPVCQKYIEYLFSSVGYALEKGLEEIIWPRGGGLSSLFVPIQIIINLVPETIVESITAPVHEMVEAINNAGSQEEAMELLGKLSVLLVIITSVLKNQIINEDEIEVKLILEEEEEKEPIQTEEEKKEDKEQESSEGAEYNTIDPDCSTVCIIDEIENKSEKPKEEEILTNLKNFLKDLSSNSSSSEDLKKEEDK